MWGWGRGRRWDGETDLTGMRATVGLLNSLRPSDGAEGAPSLSGLDEVGEKSGRASRVVRDGLLTGRRGVGRDCTREGLRV